MPKTRINRLSYELFPNRLHTKKAKHLIMILAVGKLVAEKTSTWSIGAKPDIRDSN